MPQPRRRPMPPSRRPTRSKPARRSSRRPPSRSRRRPRRRPVPPRRTMPPTRQGCATVETTAKQRTQRCHAEPASPASRPSVRRQPRQRRRPSRRSTDPNRPAGIARPDKPDDLKLISGVGPKIEGILHSLGIFTFAQVAAWQKAERDWVDGYLNFKGRIDRDDWVKQAKALARAATTNIVQAFSGNGRCRERTDGRARSERCDPSRPRCLRARRQSAVGVPAERDRAVERNFDLRVRLRPYGKCRG